MWITDLTHFKKHRMLQGVLLQIDVFILVKTYRDGAQLSSVFTEMRLVASQCCEYVMCFVFMILNSSNENLRKL